MNRTITIYFTEAHDHAACLEGDKVIFQNDYGWENILKFARYLEIEVKTVKLDGDEWEKRFS